jgi:hypothetical protein
MLVAIPLVRIASRIGLQMGCVARMSHSRTKRTRLAESLQPAENCYKMGFTGRRGVAQNGDNHMSRDTRMDPSPLRNSICDACKAVTTHKDGNCIPCMQRGMDIMRTDCGEIMPTFDIVRSTDGTPHMVRVDPITDQRITAYFAVENGDLA